MQKLFQPNLLKQLTFHKVKKPFEKNLQQINSIIKSYLLDYQYFKNYEKQQLNMIDGQRALKMNGVKIVKENQNFYVQIYFKDVDSSKNQINVWQNDKIPFCKISTITDPKHMIQVFGYSTKQVCIFQSRINSTFMINYKYINATVMVVLYQQKEYRQSYTPKKNKFNIYKYHRSVFYNKAIKYIKVWFKSQICIQKKINQLIHLHQNQKLLTQFLILNELIVQLKKDKMNESHKKQDEQKNIKKKMNGPKRQYE